MNVVGFAKFRVKNAHSVFPDVRWFAKKFCRSMRTAACYRMATGLTGEPVPPTTRKGFTVSINS